MMKTAEVVRRVNTGAARVQWLYRRTPAMKDADGGETAYVVVSAADVHGTGPETYILAADHTGKITRWLELPGSYRGGLDPACALRGAGYTVVVKGEA